MRTAFDDFFRKKQVTWSDEAQNNYPTLYDAMSSSGFEGMITEWWHYNG